MANDICESARDTYEMNHKLKPLGDICDIDPRTIKPYDILCAGCPCESFSRAGFGKGFRDGKNKRGEMFFRVMKFVKINQPRFVIFENVYDLIKHHYGESFRRIKKELRAEGYKITYKVLKCSDYGIPQMRKRLFIVGIKNVKDKKLFYDFFNLSKYEKKTTLKEYLGRDFYLKTAYTIRCGGRSSPIHDRHNWDGYWVKNNGIREEYRLRIPDALKLQGFENYVLCGTKTEQWKMLGNTIPTIFTEIIGKQILNYLKKERI
jgi:DNA (cytosine-5)-methyltransferase 1